MQIIHKLYREDIIEILEEKYGITTDKITVARDKLTEDIFLVEVPPEVKKPEAEKVQKDVRIVHEDEQTVHKDEQKVQQNEPDPNYDRYEDDKLAEDLAAGKTVPGICREYGFGKRAEYKLYKRAQRLRSEAASFSAGRRECTQEA